MINGNGSHYQYRPENIILGAPATEFLNPPNTRPKERKTRGKRTLRTPGNGDMEKRNSDRRLTYYHSEIHDEATGKLFGRLVDVSQFGCRAVLENEVRVGAEYDLVLDLPTTTQTRQVHRFHATIRWCRPDVNDSLFAAGLLLEAGDVATQQVFLGLQRTACFQS